MQTITLTDANLGCHLDSHRGHYIGRDAIELAQTHGFIVGQFEQYALDRYEQNNGDENYPHEGLIELCDAAVEWLNSGQDKCECATVGPMHPGFGREWETKTDDRGMVLSGAWVICRKCSGSGRGPRESGQNFPPIVPEGAVWMFNDGDFGLYMIDEDGEVRYDG